MKNIKFRAWHNYRKKMYEVQSLDFFWGLVDLQWWEKDKDDREIHRTFQESINGEVDSDMSEEDIVYNSVFGIELMQFTGLYDDDGKEIYEGDIVEIQNNIETKTPHKSEVIMNYNGALVKYHPIHQQLGHNGFKNLSDYCNYGFGDRYNVFCKVVGNIYENPELLK